MIPLLDERQKRLYLAKEALSYGRGGISLVSRISGMSRTTITKAAGELNNNDKIDGKTRRSGGGRKYVESNYPGIEEKILKIIDGKTYGDPMRVLSYTTESLRKIQTELEKNRIHVGHVTIGKILGAMGYSKQINQKMLQAGEPHPDRNTQFEYINATAAAFLEARTPVISVDTKKKEHIGNFKNTGRKTSRERCLTMTFPLRNWGKSPHTAFIVSTIRWTRITTRVSLRLKAFHVGGKHLENILFQTQKNCT
jgi:hypothetical protein